MNIKVSSSDQELLIRNESLVKKNSKAKRCFDILIAVGALIILSPLYIVTALLVKAESRGPVFFKQERTGLNGKIFLIYKFRSMRLHQNEAEIIKQASKNDARITKVGKFIRRASIDELPQFINVLLGDMSVVGPRPHAVSHDEYYASLIKNYADRQLVKPGITGLAQVNGYRGETDTLEKMKKRVAMDIEYIRGANLILDIKIVLLTPIRLFSKNAY